MCKNAFLVTGKHVANFSDQIFLEKVMKRIQITTCQAALALGILTTNQ